MSNVTPKEQLKKDFSTGMKLTQSKFEEIFDSFYHKNDKIDVSSTTDIYSMDETDELISKAVTGSEKPIEFGSIAGAQASAIQALNRANEAYTIATAADGESSRAILMATDALNLAGQLATTDVYGRVALARNTGDGSDSGKVPVLQANGKLHPNVLSTGHTAAVSVRYDNNMRMVILRLLFPNSCNYKQYCCRITGSYIFKIKDTPETYTSSFPFDVLITADKENKLADNNDTPPSATELRDKTNLNYMQMSPDKYSQMDFTLKNIVTGNSVYTFMGYSYNVLYEQLFL